MRKLRWIDKGTHYLLRMSDGRIRRCVGCDGFLEFTKPGKVCCHKCPPKRIRAREAAERAADADINPTFADRIADGMELLKADQAD